MEIKDGTTYHHSDEKTVRVKHEDKNGIFY